MAGNPNHDERGRFATAAKVAGGIALVGAAAVGGAIAAGAAHAVARDHLKREVLRSIAGKTIAKHAGRMLSIPSSHSESAKAGARSVTNAMSSHIGKRKAQLSAHLKSQHQSPTGPKIRKK